VGASFFQTSYMDVEQMNLVAKTSFVNSHLIYVIKINSNYDKAAINVYN